jgi:hypothetical protein
VREDPASDGYSAGCRGRTSDREGRAGPLPDEGAAPGLAGRAGRLICSGRTADDPSGEPFPFVLAGGDRAPTPAFVGKGGARDIERKRRDVDRRQLTSEHHRMTDLPSSPYLPLELCLLIAGVPSDLSTRKNLALTCHAFLNELRPRLYSSVTYRAVDEDEHARRFPEFLGALATISQYVTRFRLCYELEKDSTALVGENESGAMLEDAGKIAQWLGPRVTILELFGMGYPDQLQPMAFANFFPKTAALCINDIHPFNFA